jgi:hypothetical protein
MPGSHHDSFRDCRIVHVSQLIPIIGQITNLEDISDEDERKQNPIKSHNPSIKIELLVWLLVSWPRQAVVHDESSYTLTDYEHLQA